MLPLVVAQGSLRLRADAHSVLARSLLTSATAGDLRRGAAEPCVSPRASCCAPHGRIDHDSVFVLAATSAAMPPPPACIRHGQRHSSQLYLYICLTRPSRPGAQGSGADAKEAASGYEQWAAHRPAAQQRQLAPADSTLILSSRITSASNLPAQGAGAAAGGGVEL